MRKELKNKNKKHLPLGFTLVEIIVVIAIIIILSTMIFANYRSGEQQLALQRATSKLTQDIRRAQEMAMSSKEYQLGQIPEGGYGVYIEPLPNPPYEREYTLFADIYEPTSHRYNPGNDYLVEQIEVEKGVIIKYPIQTEVGDKAKIHITFVPPDPEVHIVPPAGSEPSWCKIILALEQDLTKTKTIKVNKAGLINIE
ncbi:prepilin-type N-terminal cleavage/methylation domain-containing protein [Patescibacteria group bacterium]|nr:prepilin-type N-terminal cleavage/methylation domain-containing protein [Patescibacteria group bacterium]